MKFEEIKRKVIMVGDFAVGKTSLVRRFVINMFDDKYIMTLGTKVTKKTVTIEYPQTDRRTDLTLMIWDILGQEGFQILKSSAYRGAKGALIVADLTRKETLESLEQKIPTLLEVTGEIPIIILGNKNDLKSSVVVDENDIIRVAMKFKAPYLLTSAKTGENVEEAFSLLANMLIRKEGG